MIFFVIFFTNSCLPSTIYSFKIKIYFHHLLHLFLFLFQQTLLSFFPIYFDSNLFILSLPFLVYLLLINIYEVLLSCFFCLLYCFYELLICVGCFERCYCGWRCSIFFWYGFWYFLPPITCWLLFRGWRLYSELHRYKWIARKQAKWLTRSLTFSLWLIKYYLDL